MKPSVLYISYDGLMEPLGQSQVLYYLQNLSNDFLIVLLTYEKAADLEDEGKVKHFYRVTQASNIKWIPLKYHKSPTLPATLFDISHGVIRSLLLFKKYNIKIIHARSYIAGTMAVILKKIKKVSFIFDIRGFWIDERVDGNLWGEGSKLYKLGKLLEKKLFGSADVVVTLTHKSLPLIEDQFSLENRKISCVVIPTCVDTEVFKRRDKLIYKEKVKNLTYIGSIGTWYLFEPVLKAFKIICDLLPEVRLTIVNRNDHALIEKLISKEKIEKNRISVLSANHKDVARILRNSDAGIFFIKSCFSKQASSPTKLAEYLACGVPCLSNSGVGDVKEILEQNRVGVVVDDYDELSLITGLQKLISLCAENDVSQRCVDTADRIFSLSRGVEGYRKVYNKLLVAND